MGIEGKQRPSCGRIRRCFPGFCQKARERSAERKFETHLLQKDSHHPRSGILWESKGGSENPPVDGFPAPAFSAQGEKEAV